MRWLRVGMSYLDSWCPVLVVDNLNVFECSTGTLALNTQRLEHGFLGGPLASEAGLWAGSLLAVGNLLRSEVALELRANRRHRNVGGWGCGGGGRGTLANSVRWARWIKR